MLRLRDIMSEEDLGRFQKLVDNYCAKVRSYAKSKGKWVTGKSASLLTGTAMMDVSALRFNFDYGGKPAQFWQLETGRKAGKQPPVSPIKEWIRHKGITPKSGSIDNMAWAIAINIAKEGNLHQKIDIHSVPFKQFQDSVQKFLEQWMKKVLKNEVENADKNIG